jgi:hypothetical protein
MRRSTASIDDPAQAAPAPTPRALTGPRPEPVAVGGTPPAGPPPAGPQPGSLWLDTSRMVAHWRDAFLTEGARSLPSADLEGHGCSVITQQLEVCGSLLGSESCMAHCSAATVVWLIARQR